jgi:hypothetical protein
MNADNPIRIDLFGVSATGTKDTRLAEHIGGSRSRSAVTSGNLRRRTCRTRRWCTAAG